MDRLPQLRAAAGLGPLPSAGFGASLTPPESAKNFSMPEVPVSVTFKEPPSEIDQDTIDTLAAFYKDSAEVQTHIATIKQVMEQLQQKHTENMQTVDEARSKVLRGEIDDLSRQTGDAAKAAKDKLDAMAKNTASLKETPDSMQANSAIIRIEENQYTHLVLKLTTAMAEYQRHQSANEAFYKAQTQRQIKIKYTNPDGSAIDDATAAQLAEQVLENNTTSYIFQQSKDVLASIIETRNDIYRIEQSMRDLNQLFNDLAFLVNEQGELMDVILANVQQSTRYVEKGRAELKKARNSQKLLEFMDRLTQLHAFAQSSSSRTETVPPSLTSETWTDSRGNEHRVRQPQPPPPITPAFFTAVCGHINDIRCLIARIETNARELTRLQEERRVSVHAREKQSLESRMRDLSRSIGADASAAKTQLDVLSKHTASLKETPDSMQANSAIIRIEENQYTHLVLKLTTAMAEYQRHQSANEAFYKAQTQRQIKIKYTNPDGSAIDDATAAQLAEQVLENNTTSYIFQQSKDVLASIIETRNDIYRIEQSMRDLNQLFNDLAFLVNEQDEGLDLILVQLQRSTGAVEKGRVELKQARKYNRSIRRKVVGSVVVAGAVVAAAAGGTALTALAL